MHVTIPQGWLCPPSYAASSLPLCMHALVCKCKPAFVHVPFSQGLLALSALIRHCKPALELFRLDGGLLRLVNLAGSPDSRVQRKALALLQYLLAQHPQDTAPAVQFGCLGPCAQ
eukprot:scaffold188563_cov13-Tisochrysis_lutea.AAC.1